MANLSLNQTSGMWGGLSGILGDSWTASTFQSQSNRDTNHKRGGEGDKRVFSMRPHHHPVERIQSNGRFGNNHFHHRWVFHEKLSVGNNCPNWSECYTGAVSWNKIVKSCEGDALHQLVANAKCYSCSNVPRRSRSLFKKLFFEAIMAALGCLVSYLTLRIDVKKFSFGFRKHSLPAYPVNQTPFNEDWLRSGALCHKGHIGKWPHGYFPFPQKNAGAPSSSRLFLPWFFSFA